MLVLLGVLSLFSTTARAAFCYSHDGVEVQNSKYYNGDGLSSCREGPSTCCLPGESCGEDLLCHSNDGVVTRQYCTDPTWPSEACSALCPEFEAAGVELTKCEENVYCCGPGNTECCKKGEGIRIDKKGQIIAVGTSTLPVTTTSTSKTSATASTTTSTSTTSDSAAATTTRRVVHPAGVPSADTIHALTTSPGEIVDEGLSAGAGAGIGVGCAVAVGILGALVWIFLRERKKRRALEARVAAETSLGYNSPKQEHGYYQPSMHEKTSPPVTQIHEVPASEPPIPELHGNSHQRPPS